MHRSDVSLVMVREGGRGVRGRDGRLRGVGKTALGMALVRAQESRRQDRLFDDPYAQAFTDAAAGVLSDETAAAGERVPGGPLARLGEVFAFHAVIRTR